MNTNIILIGMKGCGKSTVGKLLADKLQLRFVELDVVLTALHTKKTGKKETSRELFLRMGEAAFRALETEALQSIRDQHDMLLSCGGGTPLSVQNQTVLRSLGTIVFLDTDENVLLPRLMNGTIPAFVKSSRDPEGDLRRIIQSRHVLYRTLAHVTLTIGTQSPEEIVERIMRKLQLPTITGETKVIGFLGETVKTSKMFSLYNAAFRFLHLPYVYVPFTVSDLEKSVAGIRAMGIHAVGVTIPYKTAIIPFLDTLGATAQKSGSVNAVVNTHGVLTGYNTDGDGAILALKEKTTIQDKTVVLLGAGGAARSIAHAVRKEGGNLKVFNRTWDSARKLASEVDATCVAREQLPEALKHADILINATSVGMAPDSHASLVPKQALHAGLVVLDIVGRPAQTQLLFDAQKVGCTSISAARMLLWQAVLKFRIFTGVEAPVSVMESILKEMEVL